MTLSTQRIRLGAGVLGLLAMTACSSTGPAAETAPMTGSPCSRSVASGTSTLRLDVNGHQRTVLVHIPTGYSGHSQVSLVLNMHGSESNAHQQELFSGMDATSNADGFVVAYPQALIPAANGYDWNIPGVPLVGGQNAPPGAANDVSFLTKLVPNLAARYCIDTHHVYATGMSGGGRMASQLACDASSTFAAVAPVAGLRFPSSCRGAPTSIVAFHGTSDPVDPYDGNGQAYWTYSVPTAESRWAAHDGCQSQPHTKTGNGYTLTSYVGCADGATIELYSVANEGHEWPGGPHLPKAITAVLGAQSNAVGADATMWAVFKAASR